MGNEFLRKYVMKRGRDADYLHSSEYARAQSGDGIGATGGAGEKRLERCERKYVEGYDRSGVMGAARMSGPKAKAFVPGGAGAARGGLGARQGGAGIARRPLLPKR